MSAFPGLDFTQLSKDGTRPAIEGGINMSALHLSQQGVSDFSKGTLPPPESLFSESIPSMPSGETSSLSSSQSVSTETSAGLIFGVTEQEMPLGSVAGARGFLAEMGDAETGLKLPKSDDEDED